MAVTSRRLLNATEATPIFDNRDLAQDVSGLRFSAAAVSASRE
jgi:hypothetical protein